MKPGDSVMFYRYYGGSHYSVDKIQATVTAVKLEKVQLLLPDNPKPRWVLKENVKALK